MSYHMAKQCFEENKTLIGAAPMADPQNWNLNNGLVNLANAVESDLAEIKNLLIQIANALNRR